MLNDFLALEISTNLNLESIPDLGLKNVCVKKHR